MLAVLIYQKDLNQEPLLPEGLEKVVEELTGGKEEHHLVNWSNTHECRPKRFYQPETQEELEAIVKEAHNKGAMSQCIRYQHIQLFVLFPFSTPDALISCRREVALHGVRTFSKWATLQ